MKIALVNLPWRTLARTGVRAGSRWPHLKGPTERDYLPFPFFLSYSAALLKKHHFEISLIDAIAEDMFYGQFLRLIKRTKPDLLVCETSTVTLEHDLRLLAKIEKGIPITICGPDTNIRQKGFLKNHKFINYVLIGEYEFALLDLARHLKEGRDLSGVPGLIYRDYSGDVKINPSRPVVDLDGLCWPLREGLPMERYNDTPGDMPLPSAQILASRGCPYKCKFCLWPQVMYQSSHYRTRDVADVVDEMEYLAKEMGFKSIYFDDDTFNIGKARMLLFCDEVKKRKLNIPWAIMARADLMDEEILENMREAGLYAVKYGVESASQKLLDNIDKNMDIGKTEEIIKLTKMLGIKTHLTFTFGLPGETKETVRKTIDFALRLDPTTIQFSIATPFPGTQFYKEMEQKGCLLSNNWAEYDGNNNSVIEYGNITKKDLQYAIRSAYKEWALHCAKRKTAINAGYCQLILKSLARYGFLMTLFKTARFLSRRALLFLRERVLYKKEIEKEIKEAGLKIGRLTLLFTPGGLELYWDNMKLTRAEGLISSFFPDVEKFEREKVYPWNTQKLNANEFLLRRRLENLALDEIWKIKVIDEKQISWDIEINIKKEIKIPKKKIGVILSERYLKWVDSWGEGFFPPVHNTMEAELRNPKSIFIGLRGRKKLRGQIPTVLLDLSENNANYVPLVKNVVFPAGAGARMIGVKAFNKNGDAGYAPGIHKLFSGIIKIVEEDFSKRKSS
ncbi:MAG: radical SAM protein [Candidatus Omnitrophica bacterium]|nr:radical SAM protein [Candidatus Omnitrophota bacterium]MDD5552714.1 radical SAM protein [Candidatus Omnitrophota bacterium]